MGSFASGSGRKTRPIAFFVSISDMVSGHLRDWLLIIDPSCGSFQVQLVNWPYLRETFLQTRIFQVDAFSSRLFGGNPAAVMPLERFLPDNVLQALAAENNLAETAFIVADGADYLLRWFTPTVEVPLCGHATLASAAVVMERLEPRRSGVTFHSASGALPVSRAGGAYLMNFPARPSEPIGLSPEFAAALGAVPLEVHVNEFNYLAVFEHANIVRELVPDIAAVARLDRDGVIVTAPGDGNYDFFSRYFAPAKGIPEDPATGSAHCMLAPYWSKRLAKTSFRAFQSSPRGGEIVCALIADRVELQGSCVFYLEGEVHVDDALTHALD
jgi:PhzF family phenazine biosynthesis protein